MQLIILKGRCDFQRFQMLKRILIIGALISLCFNFYIKQDYAYINSSFSQDKISISMNFHFEKQPLQVLIQSASIFSKEQPQKIGRIISDTSINFQPPFDRNIVSYNNFEEGQYWFGIKLYYPDKKNDFEKMKLSFIYETQTKQFVILVPLFKMPLTAFQIWPRNTLYKCQNTLISFFYDEQNQEIDLYTFSKDHFQIIGEQDWGFSSSDNDIKYSRFKSKKQSEITVRTNQAQCILSNKTFNKNASITPSFLSLKNLLQQAYQINKIQQL